jgi:GT2 family glycosyltransferase
VIDLSVVVLSWNTRELTLACLAALEAEGLASAGAPPGPDGLRAETILVDNGSTDGTAPAARARFAGVEVVALAGNLGFAAGNNAGLARTRGRVIVLLNSDVTPTRDALVRCFRHLETHPDVGAVGVQLLHPDGRLQNSVHRFPSLLTELVPRFVLEALLPARFPSKRVAHEGPVDVDAVLGACLAVRREVLERVGGLPEEYFLFLEETDWCWSIREAGYRVVHLPDVRLVHLSGASSKKKVPARTRIEYHRALYRFFRRHRGRAALAALVALRVVKGIVAVLSRLPAALVSARGRARLRERSEVLAWHLRGCPPDAGLETPAYRAHRAGRLESATSGEGERPA